MEGEAIQMIHELQRQAEEYAEMGRDFPLYGVGSLFETLDALERALTANKCKNRASD